MKLLVFGSMSLQDRGVVNKALFDWFSLIGVGSQSGIGLISEIVVGNSPGIDVYAEQFARSKAIPFRQFTAFGLKGRTGYADMGLGLWDGKSEGTLLVAAMLKAKGKPTYLRTI